MNEQKKYEVIKSLADHTTSNKRRAALILGCSVRHINRMIKGYLKYGKGRVERLNQTLQSRLPVELKLAGVKTIDEANEFLNSYILFPPGDKSYAHTDF